jgi:glutamate--cysteine ligase
VKTLDTVMLSADLRNDAFAGSAQRAGRSRRWIGAEAEFIPVEHATGLRCPIESDEAIATLPFLREYGRRERWTEGCTSKGTPCFSLPDGGSVTFEPGGQVEYSSPPCQSPGVLLALLRAVVLPLQGAAASEGITLLTCGIDPLNSIEQAPLLIHAKRYQRMAEYLARRSEAGARMMRQTAAFQLSLDFDEQTCLRWRVLNAAAPYITAIFANSPIYARQFTGCQSARAAVWREVDPLRTGLPYGAADPIGTYLEFALAAPAILYPTVGGEHRAFGDWLVDANPNLEEWHEHLSTLFPEVRPRGHVELRSADALAPEWYAAPLALAAGITYDAGTLQAADELLGTPDPELLARSGQDGLRDTAMASVATDLFQLALTGCRRLGPGYFHPADLDEAIAFFERFTRRGRAPADELVESAIAA